MHSSRLKQKVWFLVGLTILLLFMAAGRVEELTDELQNACEEECRQHFGYGFAAGLLLMREAQEFIQMHTED